MNERYICALGYFDGVHLGHEALLLRCRELAEEVGCRTCAVTLSQHPKSLVLGAAPALINTSADRQLLLREEGGMDRVITLPFTEELRELAWQDFLELLRSQYGAVGFVCGDDYHFGYRGQGNAKTLAAYCADRGIPFDVVPEQTREGIRISSTFVRALLQEGQLERANRFLGHPHVFTGMVVPGKQLGRRLGIPTANLILPPYLVQLPHGVYACRARVDGKIYSAVTNIGTRPTVGGQDVTVEPWILDFTGDLYGREITLEFHFFLRGEEKFPDLEALKAAIHADAEKTRELLG